MWLELWRNLLCLLDLLGTLITSSILMKHLCKLFLNLFLVSFEAFFFTFIYLRFSSGILCDSIGVFSFLYRLKLKLTQGSWGQNSLQMNIGWKNGFKGYVGTEKWSKCYRYGVTWSPRYPALPLILLPIKDKIHHFVVELPFQRPITKPQKRQCYSHFNVPLFLWSSVKLQDDGLASPLLVW